MVKNLPANAEDVIDAGSIPGPGGFPWKRKWQSTPVFLPSESPGQRSLAVHSIAKSWKLLKQLSMHM